MHLFFQEKWEVEGLQTVGILLVVCSSLKLMHFLGLIDISVAGKRKRQGMVLMITHWGVWDVGGGTVMSACVCVYVFVECDIVYMDV